MKLADLRFASLVGASGLAGKYLAKPLHRCCQLLQRIAFPRQNLQTSLKIPELFSAPASLIPSGDSSLPFTGGNHIKPKLASFRRCPI